MKFEISYMAVAAVAAIGLAVGSLNARAAEKDIVDTAVTAGQLKTLAAALGAAELVDTLKGTGPFTVFAPTDDAFRQAAGGNGREPAETREQGSTDRDPDLSRRSRQSDGVRRRQTQASQDSEWQDAQHQDEGQCGDGERREGHRDRHRDIERRYSRH